MKIKLINKADTGALDVVNAETGEHIEGVTEVYLSASGKGIPKLFLTLQRFEAEVTGDLERIITQTKQVNVQEPAAP